MEPTNRAIVDALKVIVEEQMPKLSAAVHDAGVGGSLTIKLDLKPDKDLPNRVELNLTPKLALPGVGGNWNAKLERTGKGVQLSLMGAFESAA